MWRIDDDDGLGVVTVVGLRSISSWWITGLLVIGGSIAERRRGREDEAAEEEGNCGGSKGMVSGFEENCARKCKCVPVKIKNEIKGLRQVGMGQTGNATAQRWA
jgi:hypothetical protein